jgi:hypothetical protein
MLGVAIEGACGPKVVYFSSPTALSVAFVPG